MSILQGIVCANITPFDNNKRVDYESMRKLAEYLVSTGIHAIYPLGTNGEGLALSIEERKQIAETIIEQINGRICVAIQCGTQTLEDTIDLIKHAKKIGADAAGVVSPFFFHQSDKAIYDYYAEILESAGEFPIYIYNIPSHTNNDVSADVVKRLAVRYKNLAGVKFSCPDISRLCQYITAKEEKLDTLIGCDRLIYPAYKSGAVGTVTGPVAVFPEVFLRLWRLASQGKDEAALEVQYKIQAFSEQLSRYQEIPMIKQYLRSIGVIEYDTCRIPFYRISDEERAEIFNLINKIRQEYCLNG